LGLQFVKNALEGMNQSLLDKTQELNVAKKHLSIVVDKLSESEYSISKFLKAIQAQDDLHEDEIIFYQQSEQLFKKYYEEKLKFCLEQAEIKAMNKDTAEVQTDDFFEEELKGELEKNNKKHIIELGIFILSFLFNALFLKFC
jgi:hypothetical protein